MTRVMYTVDDLIAEVRSCIDEDNTESVDTDRDILPALNRAQDYAFDVLARRYPEPLLAPASLTLVGNVQDYLVPENVFEDRIKKVEIQIPTGGGRFQFQELTRISYSDAGQYDTGNLTAIPRYYCLFGRTIRIIGRPTGVYNAQIWYLRNPEKLVQPQGRITGIGSNYLLVDGIGASLTTEADQLGSYVNVINGSTGEIRGSLQIQILGSDRITFRSTPQRSTVLGRSISTLPALVAADPVAVAVDDYLAPITGTSVPYYSRPISNFLIAYTSADLNGKLGVEESTLEQKLIDKLETQIERTWVGREMSLRVKRRSRIWGRPIRTWVNRSGG